MKRHFRSARFLKPAALLSVSAAVIFGTFLLRERGSSGLPGPEGSAEQVLAACAAAAYKPSCYDKEIPKLLNIMPMEDVFEVTKIVQARDGNYWYCHVLGHELSARETKKNPGAWKDVVARCGSGMCSNGCIHGAFQERFRTDAMPDASIAEISAELNDVCEARANWDPTGMEQASCYHALGHLAMYITGANIEKSTGVCDAVSVKGDGRNYTRVCYDGVYMQIFQPLEPEDFALVQGLTPQKEELSGFCAAHSKDTETEGACLREGWPLYFEEIMKPEGLTNFCGFAPNKPEEDKCYNGLFYVITAQFNFDDTKIVGFCEGLPRPHRGTCFANAASRFIETDANLIPKSLALCQTAEAVDSDMGAECFKELLVYSTYNFRENSDEFFKLCNSMPPQWREKCLKKEK